MAITSQKLCGIIRHYLLPEREKPFTLFQRRVTCTCSFGGFTKLLLNRMDPLLTPYSIYYLVHLNLIRLPLEVP